MSKFSTVSKIIILLTYFSLCFFTMASNSSVFGDSMKILRNSGINLFGGGNKGNILNNINGRLDCSNTTLDLHSNKNINLSAKDALITIVDSTNLKVTADGKTTVNMNHDTNSDVVVLNGADMESKGNTNSKVKSNGASLKLNSNMNTKVDLTMGKLVAENNVNLAAVGVGGSAVIKHTVDHEITNTEEGKENVVLDFSFKPQARSFFGKSQGLFTNSKQTFSQICADEQERRIKTLIRYSGDIEIVKRHYKVGIFDFNIIPKSEDIDTEFTVEVNTAALDKESLQYQRVMPSTVIFSAAKEGIRQSLTVSAPKETGKIEQTEEAGALKINMSALHSSM